MGDARGTGRVLAAATAAAAVTAAARQLLGAAPPGGPGRWTRTNHRGEPISLLEGPAVAAGLVAGALAGGGAGRARAAAAIATLGAAGLGAIDDLAEDASTRTKGLRGHLGALARGQVTTGGLKVLGIGATSVLAVAVGTPGPARPGAPGTALGHAADVLAGGALVAGTANLLNLLDLRPGRALKSATALSAPFLGGAAASTTGAVLGAAAAAAPGDLGERDMLGDTGANALGALVGTQLALAAPRPVRWAALAGVVGLTLASERVSFSRVIERHDVLRRVDSWGRRPVEADPPAGEDALG